MDHRRAELRAWWPPRLRPRTPQPFSRTVADDGLERPLHRAVRLYRRAGRSVVLSGDPLTPIETRRRLERRSYGFVAEAQREGRRVFRQAGHRADEEGGRGAAGQDGRRREEEAQGASLHALSQMRAPARGA